GFQTIPAIGQVRVNVSHAIRPPFTERGAHFIKAFLSAQGVLEFESLGIEPGWRPTKARRDLPMERLGRGKLHTKHVSKILVNRRVVVDDENPTGENGVRVHATDGMGITAVWGGSLIGKRR